MLTSPVPNFTYPPKADVEQDGSAVADPAAVNLASQKFDDTAPVCAPDVLTFSASHCTDDAAVTSAD